MLSLCVDTYLVIMCFVALADLEAANSQLQQEVDELSQSSVSARFKNHVSCVCWCVYVYVWCIYKL